MAEKFPQYLKRKAGKSSIYFQRGVPKALQGQLGALFETNAGKDLAEAVLAREWLMELTELLIGKAKDNPQLRAKFSQLVRERREVESMAISDLGDNDPIDALDLAHPIVEEQLRREEPASPPRVDDLRESIQLIDLYVERSGDCSSNGGSQDQPAPTDSAVLRVSDRGA